MHSKKQWTIIGIAAAMVAAVLIGCTVVIVGALNRSQSQQKQLVQEALGTSADPSNKSGKGDKGSEDDSYTHVPSLIVSKATSIVNTLASSWSKSQDKTTKPDAAILQSAGMSKTCANSYRWIWDDVFAHAHTGGIQDSGQSATTDWAIQNVTGSKPYRVYTFTVTASLHPWYQDKNNKEVRFDTEQATWTLTVDETTGQVTKVINPTANQLSFRIPNDLVNESQQQ